MRLLHKRLLCTIVIIILSCVILLLFFNNKQNIKKDDARILYADNIIELSQLGIGENGFTCTGLCYDQHSDTFFVGDAGKLSTEEDTFHATIKQVTKEFNGVIQSINCYEFFADMRDIQGVALDTNHNIWMCSYGEDTIRCINQDGEEQISFYVNSPSGIAYSDTDRLLWVLTDKALLKYTTEGEILSQYKFKVKGQDQIFYEKDSNTIYITAGLDYFGDSYIYTFDIDNEEFELNYVLKDSYAIEGISIVDGMMYIMNDGLYHNAKVPINQVNIYNISQ